jgi:hypothetical protein
MAFGPTSVGSVSPSQTVFVSNSGAASLSVRQISLVGADADQFKISGDGCSGTNLPAGASCTLGVRFAPTASGPLTSQLRILSNAPGAVSPLTVEGNLSGPKFFRLRVHGREKRGATVIAQLLKPRLLVLDVRRVGRHRLIDVGLVRLGSFPAGRSKIHWNLRVGGLLLPKGTYKVSLHALVDGVLSVATPPGARTLIVRDHGRVRVRP